MHLSVKETTHGFKNKEACVSPQYTSMWSIGLLAIEVASIGIVIFMTTFRSTIPTTSTNITYVNDV